jgi:hypothetical protein
VVSLLAASAADGLAKEITKGIAVERAAKAMLSPNLFELLVSVFFLSRFY